MIIFFERYDTSLPLVIIYSYKLHTTVLDIFNSANIMAKRHRRGGNLRKHELYETLKYAKLFHCKTESLSIFFSTVV